MEDLSFLETPDETQTELPCGPIEAQAFARWYNEQKEDPGLKYEDPFARFREERIVPLGW